jgi:hypothetical protein
VEVTVREGVVDLRGQTAEADVPRLLAQIKGIGDMTEVVDHVSRV